MTYKIFIENEFMPVAGDHEKEFHDYLKTVSNKNFSFGTFQKDESEASEYKLEPTVDGVYYIKDVESGKYLNAHANLPIIPSTKENVVPVSISNQKGSLFMVENMGSGLGVALKESSTGMFLTVHDSLQGLGVDNVAALSHYNPTKMKLIGTKDNAELSNKTDVDNHVKQNSSDSGSKDSSDVSNNNTKYMLIGGAVILLLVLVFLFLKKR